VKKVVQAAKLKSLAAQAEIRCSWELTQHEGQDSTLLRTLGSVRVHNLSQVVGLPEEPLNVGFLTEHANCGTLEDLIK
jgi:hypothetical protein